MFVHGKNFLQRRFTFEHNHRLGTQLRFGAEECFHGKIRNEDASKRH
jgi:hypothetical protein